MTKKLVWLAPSTRVPFDVVLAAACDAEWAEGTEEDRDEDADTYSDTLEEVEAR